MKATDSYINEKIQYDLDVIIVGMALLTFMNLRTLWFKQYDHETINICKLF